MNQQSNDSNFVCPSDRQLALRAKLKAGWSTRRNPGPLKPDEHAKIIEVIKRNELLESAERVRVGKLVERVEKLKQRAAELGPKCCRLCGYTFGLLGPSKVICHICKKPVCSRCSIEMPGCMNRMMPLCKLCSETREMWKKTGAWFYKSLPIYEVPDRQDTTKFNRHVGALPLKEIAQQRPKKIRKLGIRVDDSSSDDDIDSADDEISANVKLDNITTSFSSGLNVHHSRLSQYDETSGGSGATSQSGYEWENMSLNSSISIRPDLRRASISSAWSISDTQSICTNNALLLSTQNPAFSDYKEPPLGWLELSLTFVESDHKLDCTIFRARDLPPMDNSGLADPFCRLNIITGDGIIRQINWLRTKTVHKSINPEFNETKTFLGIEQDKIVNSWLYVVLYDDDKYGNDFLGTTKVNLSGLKNMLPLRLTLPLGTEDQYCISAGLSDNFKFGQVTLSLCYNTKKRALVVLLKECTNLMAMDSNGFSDPFVKLQLKPDSHRKKVKSSIKWRNLNPVFNEEFIFETRPNDLDKQSLVVTIWDKDLGRSDDFLGTLIIGSHSKGRRLKQWRDCVRLPDHYHEQTHFLNGEITGH